MLFSPFENRQVSANRQARAGHPQAARPLRWDNIKPAFSVEILNRMVSAARRVDRKAHASDGVGRKTGHFISIAKRWPPVVFGVYVTSAGPFRLIHFQT